MHDAEKVDEMDDEQHAAMDRHRELTFGSVHDKTDLDSAYGMDSSSEEVRAQNMYADLRRACAV